jgi:hypothetical protein
MAKSEGSRREPWAKSSYSAGAQNCVEVAKGPSTGIRDTRYRELGHLDVPAEEWSALLRAVRS